jgi:ankyrin repeat protein
MLSWGALLDGYVQERNTPLSRSINNGRMEVVKLLLARPNVDINKANTVRERGGAGEERKNREGRQAGCTLGDAAEGGSPHTH